MKKVTIGCFCLVCAVMVGSGCKSAQKVEKGIRYGIAQEVASQMAKEKQKFIDEPCEYKDQYFDKLVASVKSLIVKE